MAGQLLILGQAVAVAGQYSSGLVLDFGPAFLPNRILPCAESHTRVLRLCQDFAGVMLVPLRLAMLATLAVALEPNRDAGGGTISFAAPSRVYPRMNETARSYGGLCESTADPRAAARTRSSSLHVGLSLSLSLYFVPSLPLSSPYTNTTKSPLASPPTAYSHQDVQCAVRGVRVCGCAMCRRRRRLLLDWGRRTATSTSFWTKFCAFLSSNPS